MSCFGQKIHFLTNLLQKRNCLFLRELGPETNFNRLNLVVMFICPALGGEYPFLSNLIQKKRNYQFQTEFWYHKIQICRIQQLLTFFQFWPGVLFWRKLVQTIKIVSLGWNLVPRIIQICRIQLLHSCSLFFTGNTILCANLT